MSNRVARCAADQRAHDQAWAPERLRATDGLSRFQHRVEAALRAAGQAVVGRAVAPIAGGPPGALFVTGLVGPAAARLYVYPDGLELDGGGRHLRLEAWDVRDPDDMLGALLGALAETGAR